MQLIVAKEIIGRSENELNAIYARVTKDVIRSEIGTPDRRNARANLGNVVSELNVRRMQPGF